MAFVHAPMQRQRASASALERGKCVEALRAGCVAPLEIPNVLEAHQAGECRERIERHLGVLGGAFGLDAPIDGQAQISGQNGLPVGGGRMAITPPISSSGKIT